VTVSTVAYRIRSKPSRRRRAVTGQGLALEQGLNVAQGFLSEPSTRWRILLVGVEMTMTTEALLERITIDPEICHGKPCIRHLRYPVEVILELLSSGMTTEEILADYDDLEREDVLAVLAFAARLSQVKRFQAVA
jgi:uncharacterized protein (DUF433 family)